MTTWSNVSINIKASQEDIKTKVKNVLEKSGYFKNLSVGKAGMYAMAFDVKDSYGYSSDSDFNLLFKQVVGALENKGTAYLVLQDTGGQFDYAFIYYYFGDRIKHVCLESANSGEYNFYHFLSGILDLDDKTFSELYLEIREEELDENDSRFDAACDLSDELADPCMYGLKKEIISVYNGPQVRNLFKIIDGKRKVSKFIFDDYKCLIPSLAWEEKGIALFSDVEKKAFISGVV